jgi:hypothetical protein
MMDDANETKERTKINKKIRKKYLKIYQTWPACPSVYQLPSPHLQTDFQSQKCVQKI